MRISSGSIDRYIYFVARDTAGARVTGLSSFTVYRSRNGGVGEAYTTPTINETTPANMPGVYELLVDEDTTMDDSSDTEEYTVHITATGMVPVTRTVELFRSPVSRGHSGVAQAGSTTTITLATTASSTNDIYNQQWVHIRSGNGAGQCHRISAYNGTTKVATLDPISTITAADTTSFYEIVPSGPVSIGSLRNNTDSSTNLRNDYFTGIGYDKAWSKIAEATALGTDAVNSTSVAASGATEIADAVHRGLKTIFVDKAGSDSNPGTAAALPKLTIASALSASAWGDTIRILNTSNTLATYTENVLLLGRNLVGSGANRTKIKGVSGASNIIMSGAGRIADLMVEGAATGSNHAIEILAGGSTVERVVVSSARDKGILISTGASTEHCWILDSVVKNSLGNGIEIGNSVDNVTIRQCSIESNGADGLYFGTFTSPMVIEDTAFMNNTGWGIGQNGAGTGLVRSIRSCHFVENASGDIQQFTSDVRVTNAVNVTSAGILNTGVINANTLAASTITDTKIATGAITSAKFAASAIDAAAIATDAVDEIVDQVWNEVLSGHLTAGSTGEALNNAGVGGGPTAAAIADAVWDEAATDHHSSGSTGRILSQIRPKGNTFWVSKGGNDSNDGLNRSLPKLTISAAITAASVNDTIMVIANTSGSVATFAEAVTLDKDGMSLIGVGQGKVLIQRSTSGGQSVIFSGKAQLVKGFEIKGPTGGVDNAIQVNFEGNTVEDCNISLATQSCILVNGTRFTARNCTISNASINGVNFNATCDQGIVENCRIFSCPTGINISTAGGVRHRFIGNHIGSCTTGINNAHSTGAFTQAIGNTFNACSTNITAGTGLTIHNSILTTGTLRLGTDVVDANAVAADAGTEIATAVWASATRTVSAATNITSTGGTTFTQTGDSFLRIGAAGASLTDLGGMSTAMKAQVNTEADAALADIYLDEIFASDIQDVDVAANSLVGNLTDPSGAIAGERIVFSPKSLLNVPARVTESLETAGLDHLVSVAVTGPDVADDSIIAKLAAQGGDWSTFDDSSDSLEALFSLGTANTILTTLVVNTLGTAGAGLTDLGGMSSGMEFQVQGAIDTQLVSKGLDHLVSASVTGTDIADDSIIAKMVSASGTADWDTFNNAAASLEALSALVGAIGTPTSGALNFEAGDDNTSGAIKGVGFTGNQDSGTYLDTQSEDGVKHVIGDDTDVIDIVYDFDIGGERTGAAFTFRGYLIGANDSINIQAYDFIGTDWETRFVLQGSSSTSNVDHVVTLLSKHTGSSGADLGRVLLRFVTPGGTSNPELGIDELVVGGVNLGRSVGYENGAVWIDTINGEAGTEAYVNGTADNPVNTLADALSLATSIGLSRFRLAGGSSITLTSAVDNFEFVGPNWTLGLGGQDIGGARFEGASVSGVATGTGAEFRNCTMGSVTLQPCTMIRCALTSTILNTVGGDYFLEACYSGLAEASVPSFNFGLAALDTGLNVRHYSGGIELINMGQAGTDSAAIDGHGKVVINANSVGGTVFIRGNFSLEDNGLASIVDTARVDQPGILAQATTALADIRLDELITAPFLTAPTVDSLFDDLVQHRPLGALPYTAQFTAAALELASVDVSLIADAVWDELRADHVGAGSFGEGTIVWDFDPNANVPTVQEVVDAALEEPYGSHLGSGRVAQVLSDVADTISATGAVVAGTITDTIFPTNLTETTVDHFRDAFLTFTSGTLVGQTRVISGYATDGTITLSSALTEAPLAADKFKILGRAE